MSTINDLKTIQKKRAKLIADLAKMQYMLQGTFGKNFRRCGGSTCWCAKSEKGHSDYRIVWGNGKKTFTKVIPKEDIKWAKKVTDTYRQYKKIRQLLRDLNERQRLLLNELEEEITTRTKKLRDYL